MTPPAQPNRTIHVIPQRDQERPDGQIVLLAVYRPNLREKAISVGDRLTVCIHLPNNSFINPTMTILRIDAPISKTYATFFIQCLYGGQRFTLYAPYQMATTKLHKRLYHVIRHCYKSRHLPKLHPVTSLSESRAQWSYRR